MKITIRIVAFLAMAIGAMAVITGLRVIGGFFDPGYTYYLSLVSYNVIMGAVSVIAGIYIWQKNELALMFSAFIAGFHFIVLMTLLTIFNDIISTQSIGAMVFRSSAWILFSLLILKDRSK